MAKVHLSVAGPLVSVIIPVYNAEAYLTETLQSVLAQTWQNTEIILVNDGSTDNSLQVARSFESDTVKIFDQPNKGASTARNYGARQAKGDYIKFLDADDLINPEMLQSQVNLAQENPGCVIAGQWGRFYNDDLNTFELSPDEYWKTLPAAEWLCTCLKNGRGMLQSGMFLIPREVLTKAGPWDETLTLIDDLDFFTRVVLQADKVIFDSSSTLYYRSGISGSLSDRNNKTAVLSSFKSIDKATQNLLKATQTTEALTACANVWQHFIYHNYPLYPELTVQAQLKIDRMGGSTFKFPAGGFTKIMTGLLGWKITKRIKSLLN